RGSGDRERGRQGRLFGGELLEWERRRHRLEGPGRRREAAARAVGHLDLFLPWQLVFAGREIVHVGVGAIARAAFHRDIAAMAKLVDVVLDTSVDARLVAQVGPPLGGCGLVW